MYISSNTANRIKAYAKLKGITVKDLLEICGLNKNTLSTMTARGSWIQADSLALIADKLNCSVDYLLCRTDDPKLYLLDENTDNKKAADYIDDLASNPKYNSDDRLFYIRTAASNGSAGMDESYKAPKLAYSISELEEIKKLKDIDDLE